MNNQFYQEWQKAKRALESAQTEEQSFSNAFNHFITLTRLLSEKGDYGKLVLHYDPTNSTIEKLKALCEGGMQSSRFRLEVREYYSRTAIHSSSQCFQVIFSTRRNH